MIRRISPLIISWQVSWQSISLLINLSMILTVSKYHVLSNCCPQPTRSCSCWWVLFITSVSIVFYCIRSIVYSADWPVAIIVLRYRLFFFVIWLIFYRPQLISSYFVIPFVLLLFYLVFSIFVQVIVFACLFFLSYPFLGLLVAGDRFPRDYYCVGLVLALACWVLWHLRVWFVIFALHRAWSFWGLLR